MKTYNMINGEIKNIASDYAYSTIPTSILSDKNISATAKGVLAFLLSLPKNHNIKKADLPDYFKEGYFALNNAFEELVEKRLIHKIEVRDKKGHFRGYDYTVHEVPVKRSSGALKVLPHVRKRKSANSKNSSLTNRVFNEDCLATMKRMPDEFIDMILTSPPYDSSLRKYKGNNKFDFEKVAVELTRVLKPGGILVWVIGDSVIRGSETGTSFRHALFFKDQCKLRLNDSMVFEKNTSTYPAKKDGCRYTQVAEWMLVFSKGKPKTVHLLTDKENKWAGTTNFGKKTDRDENDNLVVKKKFKPIPEFSPRTNIWRYNTGNGYSTKDKFAHKHPAIFPEKLAADHIASWSSEGDLIYDPFAGSGTTLKMAKILKRNYIGSEIVKEYFGIIQERLKD